MRQDQKSAPPKKKNLLVIGDSWVKSPDFQVNFGAKYSSSVTFDGNTGFSSKRLLKKYSQYSGAYFEKYSHGLIIAGVNDVAGGFSPKFYTHHILVLSELLKRNCITPIVLEIPTFNNEGIDRNIFSQSKRYLVSMGQQWQISEYRSALAYGSEIQDIDIIKFTEFVEDYYESQHLYRDPAHLSELGNIQFTMYLNQKLQDLR